MWFYYHVTALLKSFDVAHQIERLELPEVRALGPPKHRQQVIIFIITMTHLPPLIHIWFGVGMLIYVRFTEHRLKIRASDVKVHNR